MDPPTSPLLPGTLDLLILKTLSVGAMHGYGIAQHIHRLSGDALRVEEGSLYPALQRMQVKGWVASESKTDADRPTGALLQHHAAGRNNSAKRRQLPALGRRHQSRAARDRRHELREIFGRHRGVAPARSSSIASSQQELQAHLELLARDNEQSGMTPSDARAAARRQLGNLTRATRRESRRVGFPATRATAQDVRYALRGLRRSPGFTATVVAHARPWHRCERRDVRRHRPIDVPAVSVSARSGHGASRLPRDHVRRPHERPTRRFRTRVTSTWSAGHRDSRAHAAVSEWRFGVGSGEDVACGRWRV